jgi:hypothetical protein
LHFEQSHTKDIHDKKAQTKARSRDMDDFGWLLGYVKQLMNMKKYVNMGTINIKFHVAVQPCIYISSCEN